MKNHRSESHSLEFLQIEPTTRCNYTCGFCVGRHIPQTDLPFAEFKKIIDATPHLRHLELQGEGEPLLHPDFFTMIAYVKSRYPTAKVSSITNGSLFTAANIENLVQSNLDTLLVSIESPDAEQFQAIRGGKLARVLRGIADLMEQLASHSSRLKIGLAVTFMKSTIHQLPEIVELYKTLGLNGGISLQPLQSMPVYSAIYADELKSEIPDQASNQRVGEVFASDAELKALTIEFRKTDNFYSELYRSIDHSQPACVWLDKGLYINAQGGCNPCHFIKKAGAGHLGVLSEQYEQVLTKKAAILAQLKSPIPPDVCRGCQVAKRVYQFYRKQSAPA